MISQPVLTRDQLVEILTSRDCQPTGSCTTTGEFWKTSGGRHFLVPDSIDGYYPDWMLYDLEDIVGALNAWAVRSKRIKN